MDLVWLLLLLVYLATIWGLSLLPQRIARIIGASLLGIVAAVVFDPNVVFDHNNDPPDLRGDTPIIVEPEKGQDTAQAQQAAISQATTMINEVRDSGLEDASITEPQASRPPVIMIVQPDGSIRFIGNREGGNDTRRPPVTTSYTTTTTVPPPPGEPPESGSETNHSYNKDLGRVNINNATEDDLMSCLPGVGPQRAHQIVLDRNLRGRFLNRADFMARMGPSYKWVCDIPVAYLEF